jgi:hypothetical protein
MTNPYTPRLPTMICRPHRRKLHTRLWLRYFFFFILVATLFLDSFLTIYSHRRPTRTQPSSLYDGIQQTSAANETSREGKPEKLFIAALHHNDAKLIRSHWGPTILDLVRHFGAENIYISIVESGSHDDTKAALSELDSQLKKLGISRNIEVLETTHKDEIERDRKVGEQRWVWAEIDGERRSARRRVTWLAEWRNKVMEPLTLLNDKGKIFDKVVWVNDVVFSVRWLYPFALPLHDARFR